MMNQATREAILEALTALEEGREYQGEVLEVIAGLRAALDSDRADVPQHTHTGPKSSYPDCEICKSLAARAEGEPPQERDYGGPTASELYQGGKYAARLEAAKDAPGLREATQPEPEAFQFCPTCQGHGNFSVNGVTYTCADKRCRAAATVPGLRELDGYALAGCADRCKVLVRVNNGLNWQASDLPMAADWNKFAAEVRAALTAPVKDARTTGQWWCCKADYPNHEPTCPNFGTTEDGPCP